MSKLRSSGVAFLIATSGCLSTPTFDTTATNEPTSSASAAQDMALVPPTTLVDSTLAPTDKKPKDEKPKPPPKGGKDDGNSGPGNADDTPTPADEPATPSSSTLLVPAFWIDQREVSVGD